METPRTIAIYNGPLFNIWAILVFLSPLTMITFFLFLASWLDGYSPAIWPSILFFLLYTLPMWFTGNKRLFD
ncbi:MAG: hypothetical protein HYV51_01770 [Parcubacteria group bacterium]|nr:hypothetical protein [Parcubacteria group bacterium]